jgi:hypothetical protein
MAVAELIGVQQPRIAWVPPAVSTELGKQAVELSRTAGLELDPWQEFTLENSLGVREDGKWAAFEVGVNVPRQNGKGGILEARELAGLFIVEDRLTIHSAHQFDTSLEAFRRLLDLIEDTPELDRQVQRVSRSHGEEGIELKSRRRIRFRTRTKGGGRGFSGDTLILDEAMEIQLMAHGALLPTLSARPNPQVLYTGSAVDQQIHEHGVVFSRVRERGMRGGERGLMYVEWSADADLADAALVADDREAWAQANPGLGIRISEEHIGYERASMDPRTFAVERLGIGDWPDTSGEAASVIDPQVWAGLTDAGSTITGDVVFALDVAPDRSSASVAASGLREDGLGHVEIIKRARGTGWVVDYVAERVDKHGVEIVLVDGKGPAGSLIEPLQDRGVNVVAVNAQEHAQACGVMFDTVEERALRHLGTQELAAAVRGAAKRPLGDAWAWSRKTSTVDISPLVAGTLALWGAMNRIAREPMAAWA